MKNVSNMTDVDLALLITASIRKVVNEQACQYVTSKELCKQLQMFTPDWIKKYGHLLPRVSASVVNEDTGKTTNTGYAYNIGKIRQMVDNNELTFIFKPKVEYRASNGSNRKNYSHSKETRRNKQKNRQQVDGFTLRV